MAAWQVSLIFLAGSLGCDFGSLDACWRSSNSPGEVIVVTGFSRAAEASHSGWLDLDVTSKLRSIWFQNVSNYIMASS